MGLQIAGCAASGFLVLRDLAAPAPREVKLARAPSPNSIRDSAYAHRSTSDERRGALLEELLAANKRLAAALEEIARVRARLRAAERRLFDIDDARMAARLLRARRRREDAGEHGCKEGAGRTTGWARSRRDG